MDIKKLTTDNNVQDGSVTQWFDIDGIEYGLVDGAKLIDSDGYPIEPCNDHDHILDSIKSKVIEDERKAAAERRRKADKKKREMGYIRKSVWVKSDKVQDLFKAVDSINRST